MKTIAFKRAKNCPAVKDALHPEFIVEHADTDLFDPGFHKPEDGFEILEEDLFNDELALNESKHKQFLELSEQRQKDEYIAQVAADQIREQELRKAKKEYDDFLIWKALNKGK